MSIATHILEVSRFYIVYVFSFIFVAGIIGSILNILTFLSQKQFRNCPAVFYIVVESLISIIVLLIGLLPRALSEIFHDEKSISSIILCKLRIPATQWCTLLILSIINFAAFDQYLSTNCDPRRRQLSTVKLAKRLIFTSAIIWLLYNIPFIIYYDSQVSFGCLLRDSILRQYYSYFHLLVLYGILPLLFTTTVSLLAYRNVRRIHRLQMTNTRRKLDRQMTAMIFARVAFMIICLIPFLIQRFYTANVPSDPKNILRSAIEYLVGAINVSISYVNIAVRKLNLFDRVIIACCQVF